MGKNDGAQVISEAIWLVTIMLCCHPLRTAHFSLKQLPLPLCRALRCQLLSWEAVVVYLQLCTRAPGFWHLTGSLCDHHAGIQLHVETLRTMPPKSPAKNVSDLMNVACSKQFNTMDKLQCEMCNCNV